MATIAEKKRCLIIPPEARPPAWPKGWKLPAPPWPPGYPLQDSLPARLDISISIPTKSLVDNRIIIDIRVRDEFEELTDELTGELVQIRATCQGKVVGLRQAESGAPMWSKEVLVQIGGDLYQCSALIQLDVAPSLDSEKPEFWVGLYGWEGSERKVAVEW